MLKAETVLADLVAIPSVSSVSPEFDTPNRPVIDRLADYLDGVGCRVEIMPLPEAPGKANLIATLGSGEGGVVLAGHSDTVPYDTTGWNSDPFTLTPRDGRLHGLGAADMKGFLALAVALASRLDARRLKHPLHVVATADEESRMDGARLLAENGRPEADYCIIGEPTDLKPVRMHKGIVMEALEIHGRSGHSSDPEAAPNALDGLSRVLNALQEWRNELKTRYHAGDFAVPYPTLNFGHVHGGDNPNRICAEAELHIDLRLVPGMRLDEVRAELDVCVNRALADTGCSYRRRTLFPGVEAFETRPDSRLVKAAERFSGESAQVVSFATEAGFFDGMGMETLVLGPGRISQAHQPDEYVERSSLAAGGKLIEGLVAELTA
ncbi:MAG: acetylornithine deacetylase [Gammaproteobacteria bacterium]